jgi:PadR family transcriptional regulator PadR
VLKAFLENPSMRVSGADIVRETGLLAGTAYPILFRFERLGLLSSEWEQGDPKELGRPRRRFYHLTGDGVRVARENLSDVFTPLVQFPAKA